MPTKRVKTGTGKVATKSTKAKALDEKYTPRHEVPCEAGKTGIETGRNYARLLTSPEFTAYRAILAAEPGSLANGIDSQGLMDVLIENAGAVHRNDLTQVEAMLMNQATALQSLFVRLVESSMAASMLPQQEIAMRLALKSQAQCRATLETLAAIKNPPVVYARQANVTTGPQQINNSTVAPSRAREIENEQSKLLDTRATGATVPSNSTLEALGKIERAEIERG